MLTTMRSRVELGVVVVLALVVFMPVCVCVYVDVYMSGEIRDEKSIFFLWNKISSHEGRRETEATNAARG